MKIEKKTFTLILAAWACVVGAGFMMMTDYAVRPGATGISPDRFTDENESEIVRSRRPTLLVFAHPYCPCSRATLAELARLNNHADGSLNIKVFFYQPPDQSREWVESALWREAESIPDVKVTAADDKDLEKFGALTSGQVLLYDAENRLVFSGGITGSRGHEGDNDGRTAIENFLEGKPFAQNRTPVFGCALNPPPE